jgi:Rap1a immunity proteins
MTRSRLSLSGFILIAALMSSGGSAFAEQDKQSANYMMPGCRGILADSQSDLYLQGFCGGLVVGIFFMSGNKCSPRGVTNGQLFRVVVEYIDARPARMHEDFKELAFEAMRAAWPCRR